MEALISVGGCAIVAIVIVGIVLIRMGLVLIYFLHALFAVASGNRLITARFKESFHENAHIHLIINNENRFGCRR